MSAVPAWIQVLQALLTPAIAIAVGVIGFLQWRTAHQKVMLDLFDRRLQVFDEVLIMQRKFRQKGDKLTGPELDRLRDTRQRARLLFGADVNAILGRWHMLLIDLVVSADVLRMGAGKPEEHNPKVSAAIKALYEIRNELEAFFDPYMRMDQKRVRTPVEWLSDRNRERLSYADEKQR